MSTSPANPTICSVCQQPKPCLGSPTTQPICQRCYRVKRYGPKWWKKYHKPKKKPGTCESCGEIKRRRKEKVFGGKLCATCTRLLQISNYYPRTLEAVFKYLTKKAE